jgi:hypothetical protein
MPTRCVRCKKRNHRYGNDNLSVFVSFVEQWGSLVMNTVGMLRLEEMRSNEELVHSSEPVMSRASILLRHSPRLRI